MRATVIAKVVGATVGATFLMVAYAVLTILGLVIHVITILLAFNLKGMFAAAVSLAFPVLAEIYWIAWLYLEYGELWNNYTLAIAGYCVLWVVVGGVACIVSWLATRDGLA